MENTYKLETVFETGNVAVIAVVKSILDGSGIKYIVNGEDLQNLSMVGSLGLGFSLALGSMQVQVERKDKSTAQKLLQNVKP
jgi:hypothetical protein